jgi:16S rRNA (cytosine967-C5)-methyltransferase
LVLAPGALMRRARVVVSGDLMQTRTFAEGRVAIQDEASQLVAALVGRGEHILDCCAAPGGKTRAIAAHNPGAHVIATELHPHRARTMQRIGLPANVTVITADAQRLPLSTTFDRVLADVPCSGTGTLGRNPEIKWRLTPADLDDLQQRQKAILHAALDRLAPGGRLVYSTCSLERAEDEDVVCAVLASRPEYSLLPAAMMLAEIGSERIWPNPTNLMRGDFLRTLPGIHPCDGFFAAVLVRH